MRPESKSLKSKCGDGSKGFWSWLGLGSDGDDDDDKKGFVNG